MITSVAIVFISMFISVIENCIFFSMTVHNTDMWWNMLIKFGKQIGNSFARIINTNVTSKSCQIAEMEPFSASSYWLQKRTQNLAIHQRWSFSEK